MGKCDSNIPEFGLIQSLVSRKFISNVGIFAICNLYGKVSFDTDLKMWYAQPFSGLSKMVAIEDLSLPLVIACDKKSMTWFL